MRKNKKNKLFSLSLLLLILVLGASFVFAQERPLEVEYPQVPGAEAPTTIKTPLPQFVKYIFNFGLAATALIVFGVLIYAGFRYLTSAGNPAKIKDAKNQIFAGILGLIIITFSYLILTTINPQLIILQITRPELSQPPTPPEPVPLEEQTLYAKEIPAGKLIDGSGFTAEGNITYEGVLIGTRLNRIKDISESTKESSKKVKGLVEELNTLINQCACSNCIRGSCASGNCANTSCTSYCYCEGDPCPNREAINQKRAEIENALSDSEQLKGLVYWQKKIEAEVKGSEEIQGLKEAIKDLESAETIMKRCPSSISEQGRAMVLLNLGDFWSYKKSLEGEKIVKEIEIKEDWENVASGNDASTFYCAETPFRVSLLEAISEERLKEEISKIKSIQEEPKLYCQTEIPIGQAIDGSEAFAQNLLNELQIILDNSLNQITAANNMVNFTDEDCSDGKCCSLQNCEPYMEEEWNGCCDPYDCNCEEVCDDEDENGEKDWWNPIYWMIKPPFIYATCVTECDTCCSYGYCVGCECKCLGDACPFGDISSNLNQIKTASNNIELAYAGIKNLIEEKDVPDEINKSKIIIKLNKSRTEFAQCTNSAEDWAKALQGEKILEKQIITCQDAQNVCWDIEEGYKCYGEGDPNFYTNYFCGDVKSK